MIFLVRLVVILMKVISGYWAINLEDMHVSESHYFPNDQCILLPKMHGLKGIRECSGFKCKKAQEVHWQFQIPRSNFFFFFLLFRATPMHMEVPRLGVQSELQLPAYTTVPATLDPSYICNLHHNSRQRQILNNIEAESRYENPASFKTAIKDTEDHWTTQVWTAGIHLNMDFFH